MTPTTRRAASVAVVFLTLSAATASALPIREFRKFTTAEQGMYILGAVSMLAYNYAATGNPLRATQAMELEGFFETRRPQPLDPPAETAARDAADLGGVGRSAATSRTRDGTRDRAPLEDAGDTPEIGAPPPAPETLALPRTVVAMRPLTERRLGRRCGLRILEQSLELGLRGEIRLLQPEQLFAASLGDAVVDRGLPTFLDVTRRPLAASALGEVRHAGIDLGLDAFGVEILPERRDGAFELRRDGVERCVCLLLYVHVRSSPGAFM